MYRHLAFLAFLISFVVPAPIEPEDIAEHGLDYVDCVKNWMESGKSYGKPFLMNISKQSDLFIKRIFFKSTKGKTERNKMYSFFTEFASLNCHKFSIKKDADNVARAKNMLEKRAEETRNPTVVEEEAESKEPLAEKAKSKDKKPEEKPIESKESHIESNAKKEDLYAKTHRIIQVSVNNRVSLCPFSILVMSYVLCLMSFVLMFCRSCSPPWPRRMMTGIITLDGSK